MQEWKRRTKLIPSDRHAFYVHSNLPRLVVHILSKKSFAKSHFTIPANCHHRASVLSGALRPTRRGGRRDIDIPTRHRDAPVRRSNCSFAIFHRRGGFRGSSDVGAAPVAADAPRPAAAWRRQRDDTGRRAGPIRCTYLVTGMRHYPWLIFLRCSAKRRRSLGIRLIERTPT